MNNNEIESLHKLVFTDFPYNILDKNNNFTIIDYNSIIVIKYEFIDNKIFIKNFKKTIYSEHILRLLQKKYNFIDNIINEIPIISDLIFELSMLIINDNYYNLCTICSNQLELKGLNLVSHCSNIECKKKYYHLVIL